MRKVMVSSFVTLDGVMEDPGGAQGFKHGGWSFHFGSPDSNPRSRDQNPLPYRLANPHRLMDAVEDARGIKHKGCINDIGALS